MRPVSLLHEDELHGVSNSASDINQSELTLERDPCRGGAVRAIRFFTQTLDEINRVSYHGFDGASKDDAIYVLPGAVKGRDRKRAHSLLAPFLNTSSASGPDCPRPSRRRHLMNRQYLDAASISRALTLRDLTDHGQGPHAIQLVVDELERALSKAWPADVRLQRAYPVVSLVDNYDRLRVSAEAVSRDARYTRYVNPDTVLRTHTSAIIPPALKTLASEGWRGDVLLSCPGLVYRRDSIGRLHVGEPHQIDLWIIRSELPKLNEIDLDRMIGTVVTEVLPGRQWRTIPAEHPYTLKGHEIEVSENEGWVEVGECGLAHPEVLAESGLDTPVSGLAMGLGLDRLVMLRKRINDIRLLRSEDPRVAVQMTDLETYQPVSSMPSVVRDLSLATSESVTQEQLGDRVREALGDDASAVESIEVLSETTLENLPDPAKERLGITKGQKNLLVRVILRHLTKTLTDDEANLLRDRIYQALHEGNVQAWALGKPPE